SQPLTAGLTAWMDDPNRPQITKKFQGIYAALPLVSDVITFHNYEPAKELRDRINKYRKYGRPLICTEYMARHEKTQSYFKTNLPVFKAEKVGCYNWGLVRGKTQNIYDWWTKGPPEPKVWFHDILWPDGRPFDPAEVALIKKLTKG